MPKGMSELDHLKTDLVFLLLLEIEKITSLPIRRDRLQQVMPFYIMFLALAGVKDLMFFRDAVLDIYRDLDDYMVYLREMGFVRIDPGDRARVNLIPRAIHQFKQSLKMDHEQKELVTKAAHLAASVYIQDVSFEEIVRETHYFSRSFSSAAS